MRLYIYLIVIALFLSACNSKNDDAKTSNNIPTQNSVPIAHAGADQNVTVMARVSLDGSGSQDPDGDLLHYQWQIVSKPSGSDANLSSHTVVNPSFVADVTGSYVIALSVNDGSADSLRSVVHIGAIEQLMGDTFPSTYYPSKEHPRLWLTQEHLRTLHHQKDINTQKWQDFQAMCDSMIDADSSNDPYGYDTSPQNFTAPLALMYLLSDESAYADKALELMDSIDTNLSRYGDPDHQSWYFLALTYDWLYHYDGMTAARKTHYQTTMHTLSNTFWSNFNLNASGTDSDQNLLTGMMHLAFGAALYGDDTQAVTLLDRGWYGWSRGYYADHGISNREMIASALGGVYFTGMAYFPSTDIIGIASYEMTLESACDYNFSVMESGIKAFWSHTIDGMIALTEPNRKSIDSYGSWQDPNILSNQPWMHRAMIILSYFASKAGDAKAASLAKGYENSVDVGYNNDYFLELFFTNEAIEAINPYGAGLEYIQFFDNPDFLLFRDAWDINGSWGEFRGDGSIPLDQQSPDHGHFSLYKNGSYLTKAARNYEALSHGDFFNTLSIQNNCTLNGVSCSGTAIFDSNKSAQITRHYEHNSAPVFAYSMLNADGQWNDNAAQYQALSNVKTYRRHFFWTPKYVVILDRVRTKVPLNIRYRLRALREPIIQGDTVEQYSQNAQAKLLQKTLEPLNVNIKKMDEKEAWQDIPEWVVDASQRAWQSYIDINQTNSVNILNVIEMGDTTLSAFDRLEHLQGDNYSGVRIGDWVVNFSIDEALRTAISYSIDNSKNGMYHFISDLEEGDYSLKFNGVEKEILTVSKQSHSLFFQAESDADSLEVELSKN